MRSGLPHSPTTDPNTDFQADRDTYANTNTDTDASAHSYAHTIADAFANTNAFTYAEPGTLYDLGPRSGISG